MTPPNRKRVLSADDFRRQNPEAPPVDPERERRFVTTPWPAEVAPAMAKILAPPDVGLSRLAVNVSPTLHRLIRDEAYRRRTTARALVVAGLAAIGIKEPE